MWIESRRDARPAAVLLLAAALSAPTAVAHPDTVESVGQHMDQEAAGELVDIEHLQVDRLTRSQVERPASAAPWQIRTRGPGVERRCRVPISYLPKNGAGLGPAG
jgi:hypothetical protein